VRSERRYRRNPHWTVLFEEGLLVVHAGADAIYSIEDVRLEVAEEIVRCWEADNLDPDELSGGGRRIWSQLVSAGAITLGFEPPSSEVGLRYVGTEPQGLTQKLTASLAIHGSRILQQAEASFLVVIRTDARLRDLCDERYGSLSVPHLLIDLAYEHTVSLGPLVVPGDTACLACFVGRVTERWGDAKPPARPGIWDHGELVCALVALHLQQIAAGNHSLVNQTIAYDFADHEVKKNRIYKLPWCPVCPPSTARRIDIPTVSVN
jgi:bacteriocin biosynthesis cyclodehydratase domain-containing protein